MANPAENLADLLLGNGIRGAKFTAGAQPHVICPRCEGGTHREKSLAVKVDDDLRGATWHCHRATCGWTDGARLQDAPRAPRSAPPAPQRPRPHARQDKPDWLYRFFAERQIGARTVDAFGCYAATAWLEEAEQPAIVFPYLFGGELVNRKYRGRARKVHSQDRNPLPTLFNVDRLGDSPAEIVWVEGEPDVLALFECGIEHAVTLKDGAPKEAKFSADDKRFEALRTHADMLEKAQRIVLAGDMDGPGLALREELARRLGRHRCWLVTWPGGCKDACDVLREYGPDAVTRAIAEAQPYPIDGVQRIGPGTLLGLRQRPAPTVMTSGARASDRVLHLPTEGRLIVVTGYPGSGKTTWVRFAMIRTAAECGRRWAVFSPEMQPWEQFAAECAEVYSGKPFWPVQGIPSMTEQDIAEAEAWLSNRVTMLVCDAEEQAPTVDWILERARAVVLRDGVTDLVVDPWNEIDHQRGTASETDYTGRVLQRFKAFGLRHGCNVWVIAHPAKPPALKPGETRGFPGLYEISGSAHWFNKTDLGLSVHSPAPGETEIHVCKARFRRFGQRGAKAVLDFDALTGRYSTPVADLLDAPPPWTEVNA